jgi:hypothetical protein
MKSLVAGTIVLAALAIAARAESASSSSAASSDGTRSAVSSSEPKNNCKTVQLKPGEKPPANSGAMTSSITAGGGKVSGSTTLPNGMTQSTTGSGATSMSSSTSNGKTVVTSSDGTCTVYIDPVNK